MLPELNIKEHIPKDCFIDMRDFSAPVRGRSASGQKGGYDYEKLARFLKSLSEADIEKYREAGRAFVESDRMKPFTLEYFAQFFTEAITQ